MGWQQEHAEKQPQTARLRRLGKVVPRILLALLVLAILLYVVGFSARTTAEYDCAMRLLEKDPTVLREVGRPIRPGLFAWTFYFESGGAVRQGAFSTSVSGPKGRASVRVEFFRAPVGTLYVGIKTASGKSDLYAGPYPCE